MMKTALIVAGGKGERMGGDIPKQFLPLNGKPVLMWTLEAFYQYSNELQIILVMHPALQQQWESLCRQHTFSIWLSMAEGGPERFHSVKNGLELVEEDGLVAIHDGVRPLVSQRLVEESFRLAEEYGAAVPVMPLNETIREIRQEGSRLVDRSHLFSVQTPQAFRASLIKKAYEQDHRPGFTDDAAVLEAAGHKVHFFTGDPRNIKITRPEDLVLAEAFFQVI